MFFNMFSNLFKNKKKITLICICVTINLFTPLIALCDDGLIWEYKNDKFLEYINEDDPKKNQEKQRKLDEEIKKALDINLLPVNLEDCITIALKNSTTLEISKSQKNEAKWTFANSMTFLLPEVYYRYQIQNLRGEFLVGDILPRRIETNPVYSGVTFSYPILGDARQIFLAASKHNLLKAAGHRVNQTREDLLLNVAQYYYDLLQAKLNIDVLIINLKDRQEQLRLMQARHEIGVGTKFDVLRAEAELAIAKQELITSLNTLRLRQANLADTMGIDVTIAVYPIENSIKTTELVSKKYTIENLYDVALSLREDIKAKQREIKSLSNLKNMNYADFAPQISLSYEYGRAGVLGEGSLRPNHTWSLNVVMPIGKKLGAGTITQEKADEAKVHTAELELRRLKGDVKQYILNSIYNSSSALERIKSGEKEVEAADEGVRFALVGFDVGNNTFIDIIEAQKTKTQARMKLINSTIDYNKAQIQLLYETGIISPKSLLKCYDTPSVLNQKYRFNE